MDAETAESVLEKVERIWPMMRGNQIRVVRPPSEEMLRTVPLRYSVQPPDRPSGPSPGDFERGRPPGRRGPGSPPTPPPADGRNAQTRPLPSQLRTVAADVPVIWVSQPPTDPAPRPPAQTSPAPERQPADPAGGAADQGAADERNAAEENARPEPSPSDKEAPRPSGDQEPSEVVVAPGPGGLTIASEDQEPPWMLSNRCSTP